MAATIQAMTDTAGQNVDQTWTTRRLIAWMTGHFEKHQIESPRVVAEMLLAHVIGCQRMRLYMEVDRPATPLEKETLRDLVARAASHEPVQYLVGQTSFFGRMFAVRPGVFIPRPCTETLVEQIVHWQRASPGHGAALLADIGVGSGAIAVSLACQFPRARVIATDISVEALELAEENARRHDVADRVEFHQGAALEPISTMHGAFDAICSNPPYIPDGEWDDVAPNVRGREPTEALRGGIDGLNVVRPIIAGAGELLRPGGRLAIEIASVQREAVIDLINADPLLVEPTVLEDHEGLWRVLLAERGEP